MAPPLGRVRQTKISSFFATKSNTSDQTNAPIELRHTTASPHTPPTDPSTDGLSRLQDIKASQGPGSTEQDSKVDHHASEPSPAPSIPSEEEDPAISPSLDATPSRSLASPPPLLPLSPADTDPDGKMSSSSSLARTAQYDRFTVKPITNASMTSFGRLLKTLLPVAYPPRFFTDILATNSLLGRVAVWHGGQSPDEAIGAIKGRLEDAESPSGQPQVDQDGTVVIEQQFYIQTLGVLAPYRGSGVAARLLESVIEEAQATAGLQQSPGSSPVRTKVTSVYAHVWEANDDALGWYKRRGFAVEELMDDYYRKLKPAGAWVVRKQLAEN